MEVVQNVRIKVPTKMRRLTNKFKLNIEVNMKFNLTLHLEI